MAAAKANGSHASVSEQSGIKAGDQGFDVNVKGNTNLKGGVISSTQAAIDEKKNSFQTASLTTSDIENHSTYKASGYSVSGSVSGSLPKVYLAQLGANALKPNGALITGDKVYIEGDSIVNRGGKRSLAAPTSPSIAQHFKHQKLV